jgi:hypothetical protein
MLPGTPRFFFLFTLWLVSGGAAGEYLSGHDEALMADDARTTKVLFLRHGGKLSTAASSMDDVTKDDWTHVRHVHSTTQFFHSDFAHTDYKVARGNSASWSTPPLERAVTLLASSPTKMVLWVSTNAADTEFRATLLRLPAGGDSAVALGSATGSTLHREEGKELPLPGEGMMATGANGGYSVALPLQIQLDESVELSQGDVLRLEVAGIDDDAPESAERVNHRIWHNPKWGSTLELPVNFQEFEVPWAPASVPITDTALQ